MKAKILTCILLLPYGACIAATHSNTDPRYEVGPHGGKLHPRQSDNDAVIAAYKKGALEEAAAAEKRRKEQEERDFQRAISEGRY
jgi:hypothetical protein